MMHRFTWKIIAGFFTVVLLPLVILFLAAGRLDWWEAWVMAVVFAVTTILSRALLILKHPDLAVERSKWTESTDTYTWDKKLMPIIAIYGPLMVYIAAGLDKRWNGSPTLPVSLEIAAFVIIVLGYTFSAWALIANRFFSAIVRIQKERGHVVVSDGPYRIVRHPGYSGGLIGNLMIPLALGTLWAYIPAGLTMLAIIVRTSLEDKVLQAKLPGYTEYVQKTRYRLLPGIW
jgi:protein-S-isoprenylcysteine O-methyltransferase Ste14